MKMVEKISRQMCLEAGYDPDTIMSNDGPRWRYYEPNAQAALRALEVPTEGMVEAGLTTSSRFDKAAMANIWSAMIAAAREE
ncbi:hypothetical protein [Sphingobium amiense]|uniref:hypothetical protein n=1 Tax=Sphingobium amiense TaxID=135719 RepID=UPI00082B78AA|nr:hypothetical protein [Sphingobium amiense]